MGVYLTIISGIIKFCNSIANGLRQHHDELNGANQQKVADHAARKEVLDDLTRSVSGDESDQLWNENKARFGTATGPKGD